MEGYATLSKKRLDAVKLWEDIETAVEDKTVLEGTVTEVNKGGIVVSVKGVRVFVPASQSGMPKDSDLGQMVKQKVKLRVTEVNRARRRVVGSIKSVLNEERQAAQAAIWEGIEVGKHYDGVVKSMTSYGVFVDIGGVDGMVHISELSWSRIKNPAEVVSIGDHLDVYVISFDPEKRKISLGVKDRTQNPWDVFMNTYKVGDVANVRIVKLMTFGAFAEVVPGVDGLIHITDLSWGRVNHPEEIVALDQKINVVILDFDEAKKRIALGLKQLTPHPWEALDQTLKVGDKVKGRVVVMADYGAFVEIAPGVEGLIHVSEMSWSQHLRSAQEFMKVGDEVEAVILTLDREERKMSLGIKQLTPDPWENIEVKYPVGTKTTAKVRNFTNFGVFVEIEEGIDGLIHISDLSWTKKVKHPGEFTSVGADIEVVVLEIDKENRRLSLGHKQLEENPWNEFENQYSVDSIHEGTITEMTDKGAVVALGENIEGFCPARQLVKEDGTTPKTGDKLNFKILEFSKATKRITLSHLRTYEEAKRAEIAAEKAEKRAAADATKSTVKKINASVEKTTLGDIAGLAALKSAMEAAEAKSAKKAAAKKDEEPKEEENKGE